MKLNSLLQQANSFSFAKERLAKDKADRETLLKRWPREKLTSMSVEEYADLSKRDDCFIYWLEFKKLLAGIRGGNASKHGIYRSKAGDYVTGKGKNKKILRGKKLEQQFSNLRQQINDAIKLAEEGQVEEIEAMDCPIWNMVLLKILYIYVPNKFISAFSSEVLREAAASLEVLSREAIKSYKCIALNYHVNKKMNEYEQFKDWTTAQRGIFIWDTFQSLADKNQEKTPSASRQMSIAALYLSKFGEKETRQKRFGTERWKDIYEMFHPALGRGKDIERFCNSLRLLRDSYDGYFENERVGYRNKDEKDKPVRLSKSPLTVFNKYNDYSEENLWEKVQKHVTFDPDEIEEESEVVTEESLALNKIFYGPPGTGKTYQTMYEALEIIDGDSFSDLPETERRAEALVRFNQLKSGGQVEFISFHQSYSYEEFIEGIAPVTDDQEESINYEIRDGIFKSFVKKARNRKIQQVFSELSDNPTVWRISLKSNRNPNILDNCLKNGFIGIEWGHDNDFSKVEIESHFEKSGSKEGKSAVNMFVNSMEPGDLVCVFNSATTIRAVGVIVGDYEYSQSNDKFYHNRKVKWLDKEVRNIFELNGRKKMMLPAIHRLNSVSPKSLLELISANQEGPSEENDTSYVFIIDEINRGNISKIFGELITLLEDDKREGNGGFPLKLPYSGEEFIIPDNVHVIGTMNTADRSIAMIDMALRRRFVFDEVAPDPNLVKEEVSGIKLRQIFSSMNEKIQLLQGKDYQIGHSYLMPSKVTSITKLKHIWFRKVLPLLNEYFYEDWQKLKAIISPFIKNPKKARGLSDLNLFELNIYDFESSSMDDELFVTKMKELERQSAPQRESESKEIAA